jgi:hypothetical protein
MEETPPELNKKRIRNSEIGDLASMLSTDETPIFEDLRHLPTVQSLQPPHKKAKYGPPRPLRILRPVAANSKQSSVGGPTKSPEPPSHHEELASTPVETEKRDRLSSPPFSGASTSFSGTSESSWNCEYCKRSIEGGEAGRRRHQAGEKHLSRVLRAIAKYIAPNILPATEFKFPARLSFNVQQKEFFTFMEEQEQKFNELAVFINEPTSAPDFDSIKHTTLDVDVLMAIKTLKPKNMSHKFLNIDLVYRTLCQLKNRFPLCGSSFKCAFCEDFEALSPSSDPSVRSSAPVASSSATTDQSLSFNEDALLDLWRHFASESHRKAVAKFWREHRVRCLDAPNPSTLPSKSSEPPQPMLSTRVPATYADSASFLLTQAQLQRKLEEWAKLAQLIALIPKTGGLQGERGDQEPDLPMLPPAIPPAWVSPISFESVNLSIKDTICKFMKPGEAKRGERIGSKWADAVKAFSGQ